MHNPAADPPAPSPDRAAPLSALVGAGRSGTTWLGALLSSHPDVSYRFEPFLRMKSLPAVRHAWELLNREPFSAADARAVYEALLPADPLLDRPPFFRVHHARTRGKALLWTASRKVSALRPLFRALYSPRGRPRLIFKEVRVLPKVVYRNLVDHVRLIYLIRHPCGNVASQVEGQKRNLMPSGRLRVLGDLLRRHDPALADRLGPEVERLDEYRKLALLWRIDAEIALGQVADAPNGLVVVYEHLCREPRAVLDAALAHLGLSRHEQTERFLDDSRSDSPVRRLSYGESATNAYFSVFRDPLVSANKWKETLTDAQQEAILGLVSDSPAYRYGVDRGAW